MPSGFVGDLEGLPSQQRLRLICDMKLYTCAVTLLCTLPSAVAVSPYLLRAQLTEIQCQTAIERKLLDFRADVTTDW